MQELEEEEVWLQKLSWPSAEGYSWGISLRKSHQSQKQKAEQQQVQQWE